MKCFSKLLLGLVLAVGVCSTSFAQSDDVEGLRSFLTRLIELSESDDVEIESTEDLEVAVEFLDLLSESGCEIEIHAEGMSSGPDGGTDWAPVTVDEMHFHLDMLMFDGFEH